MQKKRSKSKKKEIPLSEISNTDENEKALSNALMKNEEHPEQIFLKEEDKTFVRKIINKMNTQQRLLLHLRYYQDYSIKEISEIIKKPEGTIRSRLFYAREELRYNLKDFV